MPAQMQHFPPATFSQLQDSLPPGGLFAGKRWLQSPEPLALPRQSVAWLEKLGHWLAKFQAASNTAYWRSKKGKLPAWVAELLDAGKPPEMLQALETPGARWQLPRVIRPDLLLAPDHSFQLTEIDSVPGGIGLTAWLAQTYHALNPQWQLLGGARGMLDGFAKLFPQGADILISAESADYQPEMQWLCQQLGRSFAVHPAESYRPGKRDVYRFFEMFDHANIPGWSNLHAATVAGNFRMEAPMKPWLEEKLWLALLWSRPLQTFWRQELRDAHFQTLRKMVPQSWVLDPTPLPPHAVLPGLEIQDWEEMAQFSQKQRQLVCKVSGFSENAWGSRGVTVGHDVSRETWMTTIRSHLANFTTQPAILQRFIPTGLVRHPYFDPVSGEQKIMEGRVRLCPYYFVAENSVNARLHGVLATIVPADKKIIHGMEDAILVPCRLAD